MNPRATGRWHKTVSQDVSWDGLTAVEQKVLYLLQPGLAAEPFLPFSKFVRDHQKQRSFAWQQGAALAVGSLIDFLVATKGRWSGRYRQDAFAAYAQSLLHGTFERDGSDPTGLAWWPRSTGQARTILGYATLFADWLANNTNTLSLNPKRRSTVAEIIVHERQANHQSAQSLLAHLRKRRSKKEWIHEVRIDRAPISGDAAAPKSFDSKRLHELLVRGFALPPKQAARSTYPFCVRNALIALLLHAGGLRLSEPFHLFVHDVDEDPLLPGHARVRLYHPEQGAVPADETYGMPLVNREAYLRAVWGLRPRNLAHGGQRAPWKDLFLTDTNDMFAKVEWFPRKWGTLFLELYIYYRQHCRPERACRHPFLFASEDRAQRGVPYTVNSYRQASALAMRRIGLVPAKELGTTPHGHRHAYGQALAEGKVEPRVIQRALHHRSLKSQEIYTRPHAVAMNAALQDANARLGHVFDIPDARRLELGRPDPDAPTKGVAS